MTRIKKKCFGIKRRHSLKLFACQLVDHSVLRQDYSILNAIFYSEKSKTWFRSYYIFTVCSSGKSGLGKYTKLEDKKIIRIQNRIRIVTMDINAMINELTQK